MAADPGRGSGRRFALLGAGVAVAVLAGGPTLFVALQPVQVLPRLGLAPGFDLVDQAGARLTSDDLKGGITLYGTHSGACGTDCDEVVSRMLALYDRIDETEADPFPVRLVSITPDPDGDDPADFARTFRPDADPEVWRFATGDTAHLRSVVGEGFETWHVREDDRSVTYDPALVLVDQLGVKRAVWRYQMPDVDGLVLHVRELARVARAKDLMEPAAAEELQVVMVSVDPERDTPEVVDAYVRRFDPEVRGLSGERVEIERLASAYGIFHGRAGGEAGEGEDYLVDHTATLLVLDPRGKVRMMLGQDLTAEQIAGDLGWLVAS